MGSERIFTGKSRRSNRLWIWGLVAVLLLTFMILRHGRKNKKFNLDRFDTEVVSVGNINKTVSASGMLNAKDIVEVGSQVTGVVEKVYVDFNSVVKKGAKLAKLETDVLESTLESAKSTLKQCESDLELTKLETERVRTLYKNNYIAKTELDKAENSLIVAEESYRRAKLKVDAAKVQLSYAYINSPVDGTVVSRDVNEGQTISAGYQTPVLFKIAEDLKKMQIETSITEADIGMITNDLKVSFTVDAYKDKIFPGVIKQIRLMPTVEQNVVVYTVIIDIDNKDLILLPGMTAYVMITIDSVKNVLRIPNTVFRFKATKEIRKAMNLKEASQEKKEYWSRMIRTGNYAVIYVVRNGKVEPILVEKGLSDTTYTEIKSDQIKKDDIILSTYLDSKTKK